MMIIVKPSKDILQFNKGFRFERNSSAFDEEGNLFLPHNARFLQGKFGKALFVEEGTRNLAKNPLFDGVIGSYPTGWHSDVMIVQDDFGGKIINVAELKGEDGNSAEDFGSGYIYTLDYDTAYTISEYIRSNVSGGIGGANLRYELAVARGIQSYEVIKNAELSFEWQKYIVKITTTSSGTICPFWVYLRNANNMNLGNWVHIAFVQLEQKPYTTTFTPSVRSPEIVTIPANTISPIGGQWDHYAYINSTARRQVAGQTPTLFHIPRQDGGMGIRVCHAEDTANWKLQTMDDTNNITEAEALDTLTPDGWHRFTVKWTEAEAKLLIDGVVAGTIANPALPSTFAEDGFVGSYDGNEDFLNTLHDDIRVSNIARADADDLADFETDQPLPTDQFTIHKQSFDSPNDMHVRQGLII